MTLFGPSQENNENPILTQFEPKSTSGACYGGWPIAPYMAISPQNNLIHAENTPHIGLDGRGLGFEHPEIRLWCLFWQSVKWGAPCGSCPKMTFNGLEPPSDRQNTQVKVARDKAARYRCVLEGGIIFIWV